MMRIQNSLKNSVITVLVQLLTIALAFAVRTVFIQTLAVAYLGINGLFSNILSILSLAEFGFSTAITFSLYKPLAEGNIPEISALMNLFKKVYIRVGIAILGLGMLLVPFLDFFVETRPDIYGFELIYILYVLNAAITYFCSYKRVLLVADQKNYQNILNQGIFRVIQSIIQMAVLFIWQNFIIYFMIQLICTFLANMAISIAVDKQYAYLKADPVKKLDHNRKRELLKQCCALAFHNFGYIVVLGTDNILISKYIGLYWNGLYSNYVLIIDIVKTFLNQFMGGITGSIGNLNYTENTEKKYEIFNIVMFVYFWLYGFSSIALYILINPFIELWIGPQFLIDQNVVGIAVINVFVSGMRQPANTFKTTLGLVWADRYKPVAEALINIVVSIVLLKEMGLAGVFWGTLVSTMTTSFWVEPYILFKDQYPNKLFQYFQRYTSYAAVTLGVGFCTWWIANLITGNTILDFIGKMGVCFILPNLCFFIVYYKTKKLSYLQNVIQDNISGFIKKLSTRSY